MHSESAPVQSGDRFASHNAVEQLQRAERSGRTVLIPGALEPLRHDHSPATAHSAFGPDLSPAQPGGQPLLARDREAGGVPAAPVTPLDYVELALLRLTNLMIRLLRTTPRVTAIASPTAATSRAAGV